MVKSNKSELLGVIENLRAFLSYHFRHFKIYLLLGVFCCLVGLAYALFYKPKYTAEFTFVVDQDNGGGISAYAGLASQFGLSLGSSGGGIFGGDNVIELLKSRRMIDQTLTSPYPKDRSRSFADIYYDISGLKAGWSSKERLKELAFPPNAAKYNILQDSAIMEFYKVIVEDNLKVGKPDKKLEIISASVTTKDELFSKYFIERLVENVSRFYSLTKTHRSRQNVEIIQKEVDSVKREFNRSLYGRAVSVEPNANLSRQVLSVPAQKKQTDITVLATAYGELVKNLELAKLVLLKETPLIQAIDSPKLPLEKLKISKAKAVLYSGIIAFLIAFIFVSIKYVLYKEKTRVDFE